MEYVNVYSSTGEAPLHEVLASALVRAKFNTESGMAFNSSLASSGNATASMDGVVGSEASCDAPCEVVVP